MPLVRRSAYGAVFGALSLCRCCLRALSCPCSWCRCGGVALTRPYQGIQSPRLAAHSLASPPLLCACTLSLPRTTICPRPLSGCTLVCAFSLVLSHGTARPTGPTRDIQGFACLPSGLAQAGHPALSSQWLTSGRSLLALVAGRPGLPELLGLSCWCVPLACSPGCAPGPVGRSHCGCSACWPPIVGPLGLHYFIPPFNACSVAEVSLKQWVVRRCAWEA